MNQEKIGNFIAQRRKDKKLTQAKLASYLGISDRTISKWERGKGSTRSYVYVRTLSNIGYFSQ